MKIVATTSLPAVDRPYSDRWNAARSCQKTCREFGLAQPQLVIRFYYSDEIERLESLMCLKAIHMN